MCTLVTSIHRWRAQRQGPRQGKTPAYCLGMSSDHLPSLTLPLHMTVSGCDCLLKYMPSWLRPPH